MKTSFEVLIDHSNLAILFITFPGSFNLPLKCQSGLHAVQKTHHPQLNT